MTHWKTPAFPEFFADVVELADTPDLGSNAIKYADVAELADAIDLGSGVYPQNLIGLSGYGGIGRRVRFRFLCRMACGFKSHWPQQTGV